MVTVPVTLAYDRNRKPASRPPQLLVTQLGRMLATRSGSWK
jgi:hypothetical protein